MDKEILLTLGLALIRYKMITFKGFTVKYWGDFEFLVFLLILQTLHYKLNPLNFVKFLLICFIIRELVRMSSRTKIEDVKSPLSDVVITFKRCANCSNPYDITQFMGFSIGAFCLLYFKNQVTNFLHTI